MREALVPIAVVLLVAIGCWESAARLGWADPLFFPAPSRIGQALLRMARNGELFAHLGVTLSRLAAGLLVGGVPAVALGLLFGWLPRLRRRADPIVASFHPIPKIAAFPLLMVLLGVGAAPMLALAALAAFFPLLISVSAGVQQIPPTYQEVVRSYGGEARDVLLKVVLPGSLPLLLTGVRLAFNSAFVASIAAELAAGRRGLGTVIWYAWQTMRVEQLYAGLFVVAAVGVAANWGLQWLAARLLPWRLPAPS